MSRTKWIAVLAASLALGLSLGCDSNDSDDDADGGGAATGSYAGTWVGNVCGRGLTMTLTQNGTSLSGSYAFTDPAFSDTCAGTVSSVTPPATASLRSTGGHDFWFDLAFSSHRSFSGGFYKSGVKICDVNASK
ncbi:MAG: hypothetical protein EOM72_06800 [Opitutae bacterium]|nr:hypothetical protein [Opitutae bacterium]